MHARLFTLFFGMLLFTSLADGDVKPIGYDQIFTSPDGKLSAQLGQVDENEVLSIKNNKTGTVDNSQSIELPPVFTIKWTGDSQSIVTVGHIAGGSQATVYHNNNGTWNKIDVYPDNRPAYDVIGLQIGRSSVAVSYKAIQHVTKSNGAPTAVYYKLEMNLNPAIGKITTSKEQKITLHTYEATPGAEERPSP
jgi:hypothetical protein